MVGERWESQAPPKRQAKVCMVLLLRLLASFVRVCPAGEAQVRMVGEGWWALSKEQAIRICYDHNTVW